MSAEIVECLFLAYYFPPAGGGGTQRSAKFTKHLPEFGVAPIVLTIEPNEGDRWAPLDEDLCGDIPAQLEVRRVPLAGRSKRSVASSQLLRRLLGLPSWEEALWRNEATIAGRDLLKQREFKLIFATMSPFESSVVAGRLSKEFGIPWVADLRDPWALDEWQVYPTCVHRWLRRREMRRKLRSASLIIMNTPEAARKCRETFHDLAKIPIISITNGFDIEDFPPVESSGRTSRFTIVHAGSLHTRSGLQQQRQRTIFRLFGRLEEGVQLLGRSHYYLLKALEFLVARIPEARSEICLKLVGYQTPEDQQVTERSTVSPLVESLGYCSHFESVNAIRNADLLFLPMHDMPAKTRATIVPGKVYEYMAAGKPILAAVPDGDARDFLNASELAKVVEPDDIEGMTELLQDAYLSWKNGPISKIEGGNRSAIERFDRKRLTQQLAEQLLAVAVSAQKKKKSFPSGGDLVP